mmetsp:Transcript_18984/g.60703  ORF Transcript_18984/g.60703 Transcript_18984/m.60703 type:complete len:223 (+) Transcript_18984:635-1303(+)
MPYTLAPSGNLARSTELDAANSASTPLPKAERMADGRVNALALRERVMRFESALTSQTKAATVCPRLKCSLASLTNPSETLARGTRPVRLLKNATNTPMEVTLETTPTIVMPGLTSSMDDGTRLASCAALRAGFALTTRLDSSNTMRSSITRLRLAALNLASLTAGTSAKCIAGRIPVALSATLIENASPMRAPSLPDTSSPAAPIAAFRVAVRKESATCLR